MPAPAVLNTRYRGRIIRLLLAELAPHGKIAPHRDGGAGTVLVHRLHVPVLTDPEVKFYIDEIPHMLEAGVAYEFDNTRRHAVENESDRPRIHLMCDIHAGVAGRLSDDPVGKAQIRLHQGHEGCRHQRRDGARRALRPGRHRHADFAHRRARAACAAAAGAGTIPTTAPPRPTI